ncbi:MAG: hypothetical protein OXH06_06530 [Gemmatimonadetes bacterium]|nr:hypothetical protein [Gemmatimonadota bacterium]
MKTKKTFDCVEMKRRGAERIQGLTAGMTMEEQLVFWKKRTELLQQFQQAGRVKHKPSEN